MTPPAALETPRLLLRPFVADDAGWFLALNADPRVTRYTWDAAVLTTVEQARQVLLDHPIADYGRHGFGRWACVLKACGTPIGFAGLKRLGDLGGEVDVGYRLLPAHWGAGLATEAAVASVRWGLDTLGLPRIIGLVDPENVASVRVLEKAGLAFEALFDYHGQRLARYAVHSERKA
jgi:RimJ/RimL family protein N-acetyltransferase